MSDMMNMQLTGNLGADPNVNEVRNGGKVANFNVACSVYDASVESKYKTIWVSCSWFGKRGEKMPEWARKGDKVWLYGKPEIEEWTDGNGVLQKGLKIRVDDCGLAKQPGQSQSQQQPQYAPAQQPAPQPQQNWGQGFAPPQGQPAPQPQPVQQPQPMQPAPAQAPQQPYPQQPMQQPQQPMQPQQPQPMQQPQGQQFLPQQ